MKYFGLQSQIRKNNLNSILLLILFPLVFFGLSWLFFFFSSFSSQGNALNLHEINRSFVSTLPWITAGVVTWFVIAYFSHVAIINSATSSAPLERKNNKRVYNLVENLCIASGMQMPKINIIEDDSLNAFASGINPGTYSVSLSRGIIDKLDDDELEAVIAHELTHIRNRDVRLLVISIVFVGIFAFIAEMLFRSLRYGRGGRNRKEGWGVLVALLLALVGYLIATLFRFALSRKREYLADAGAAELTRRPLALASALRKISADPTIEAVRRKDIAQMFIENPGLKKEEEDSFSLAGLFSTHPPIKKRIRLLEQY